MKYSVEEKHRIASELRKVKQLSNGVTSLNHGYLASLLLIVLGNDVLENKDYDNYFEYMCVKLADLIDS